MKNMPEDKLITFAIEGNEKAWNEMYRRYHSRVRRVVSWKKWGFRRAEAEEIMQDVFLELIKALPNFRRESSLSTFLTRLAKNKCISVLRRKGAQKRAREEYGFTFDERKSDDENSRHVVVASNMGNPQEKLLLLENADELMEALKQLSPDCQEVIDRRYFKDLAYREICDQLDLPLGTVCSRLKRCLLRLKEIYLKKSE